MIHAPALMAVSTLVHLSPVDLAIIVFYFALVLAIGLYLKRNRGMSFVARDGAELVGAVLSGHDGRRGCLYHLAIAPSHRRNGLGTKLVARCLAELKKAGILNCNIFVYANNTRGERFWRRNGWKQREDLRMAQRNVGSLRVTKGC